MAVNKREREVVYKDLAWESVRLRDVSPDKLAKSMDDLNSYVLKSTIAGIKMRNPGMPKSQLSAEIRKAFA